MNTQIVVLGSHRSGTSALTGLLQRMGAHVGAPEELMTPEATDNPTGYFERLDVTRLDEELLQAMGCAWDAPPVGSMKRALKQVRFPQRAAAIVNGLAAHPVSAMKDPRQCLLFHAWRPMIPNPVCIIVFRNPLEIAKSQARRDATPIPVSIALWELYMRNAIAMTDGLRRHFVTHAAMLGNPAGFAADLAARLALPALDPAKAGDWIEQRLHRNRASDEDLSSHLNAEQQALAAALRAGDPSAAAMRAPLSREARAAIEAHRPAVHLRPGQAAPPSRSGILDALARLAARLRA